MEIFVCKGYSGNIHRLTVNEFMPLAELLPVMARSIGYYSSNEENLGLYNMSKDFEYSVSLSLNEAKTENGDLLLLADGAGCYKK